MFDLQYSSLLIVAVQAQYVIGMSVNKPHRQKLSTSDYFFYRSWVGVFVKELQVYSKVRCVKEKSIRTVQFAKLLATQIVVTKTAKTKFPKIRCTGCVSHRISKFW